MNLKQDEDSWNIILVLTISSKLNWTEAHMGIRKRKDAIL